MQLGKIGYLQTLLQIETIKNNKYIGNEAENAVVIYMAKNGYKILAQNLRMKIGGEIDIVSEINNYIVFTEVKYRSSPEMFHISERQIKRIKQAALHYISKIKSSKHPRFDVAIVTTNKIHYIENAFM